MRVINLLYNYSVHVFAPSYIGLRMTSRAAHQTDSTSTFHLQDTVFRSDGDNRHRLHLDMRDD